MELILGRPDHHHRSSASKEAAAPVEIMLTDTACQLTAPSNNVIVFGVEGTLPADMVLSTKTPGCDIEESFYITIGGMIIPSFFADDEVIGAVGIFVPRALTCSDNLEKHLLPQLRLMADTVAKSSKEVKKATKVNVTEISIAMAA